MDARVDGGDVICEPPRMICADRCVDPESDPQHCGGCDMPCSSAAFCSAGSCNMNCGPGLMACGAACVDIRTSHDHCGGCDMPCADDRVCRLGGCTCGDGLSECGGACIDTTVDPNNCGICGRTCAPDEECRDGSCRVTVETECLDEMDDDDDGLTDCEDPECVGTERDCMCPDGLVGMGRQICQAETGWSECLGCEEPPECETAAECPLAHLCVGGMCVFDRESRWDIFLLDGNIPTTNYYGAAWDAFGGRPDPYVTMRTGSSSGMRARSDTKTDTVTPMWMEHVVLNVTAQDILDYLRVEVFDEDLTVSDSVGACIITLVESSFDGSERIINCSRSDRYRSAGWRLRIRLDPVMGIGS